MRKDEISSGKLSTGKRRSLLPGLCSIIGSVILVAIILAFFPLTVPRLMGYEIYEVVSGSMEPEIPVGSVIYVKSAKPEEIEKEDIIAFQRGDSVITHRVVENRFVEGEYITKGDANEGEDMTPIPYDSLIGRVTWHIPVLGTVMSLMAGTMGKFYAAILAACGVMFHMLAGSMRAAKDR